MISTQKFSLSLTMKLIQVPLIMTNDNDMIKQTRWAAVFFLAAALLCGTMTLPAVAQTDATAQQRAKSSVDNSKQARKVILNAIFSGQTLLVANAYETAMKAKPASEVRIANFAWAAMMAARYSQPRQDHLLERMVGRAVHALKPLVVRIDVVTNAEQARQWSTFRKTKVATAWLSWGYYLSRFCFDKTGAETAYKYALSLDPHLAEVYFEQAEMAVSPYESTYLQMHQSQALKQLSKAEQLEPILHPLTVRSRAYIALGLGKSSQGASYLREYLRLWPTAPFAERLRQDIATLDAKSGKS